MLSHDQIEAVLMRRAGYEVRVLPEEGASFEQNPPTLLEFIRRDLRWCQGNMQYWPFLLHARASSPSAATSSLFALLMFLGSPAWIGLLVLGTLPSRPQARRRSSSVPMPGWRCSAHAGDVVCAEDRDRDRRADAADAAARLRRRAAVSSPVT